MLVDALLDAVVGQALDFHSPYEAGIGHEPGFVFSHTYWMVTPRPVVTIPTIRSPGNGWQQPAKCMAMPGISP